MSDFQNLVTIPSQETHHIFNSSYSNVSSYWIKKRISFQLRGSLLNLEYPVIRFVSLRAQSSRLDRYRYQT